MAMRRYFVYIMTNHARTLYTGITNDLERRIREHKAKLRRGFTKKHHIDQLVWFEDFYRIDEALLAEKRIEGWLRAKKIALVEATNPLWLDLADQVMGHACGSEAKTLRQTSG
jgi:putative endonuclease